MFWNSGPRVITTLLVSAFILVANLHAQHSSIRGQVPGHERVAASILRRKTASHTNNRTASRVAQAILPAPAADELPSVDVDLPPAPPAESDSAAPTSPTMDPSAAMTYGDPTSIASDSMVIGCSEGCDGCASPGCRATSHGGRGSVGCDGRCGGRCRNCYLWIDTFSLNVGVQGFINNLNRGESASFGLQQGFNWGSPWIFTPLCMNTQLGFRATQTDFNGANFTTDEHAQFFVTAGFFKRNYHGWQGGIVFDYLHDDWYTTIDLGQIRGELSYGVPNGSSVGMWFATSAGDDETTASIGGQTVNDSWETHDICAAFYKVQSNQCRLGQWRFYAGVTGERDGIIGTDFKVPVVGNWSLEPEFTYLIPDEATGQGGHEQEAWNIAFNLVWYPARVRGSLNYGLLPMFDVANNGSMITRRR